MQEVGELFKEVATIVERDEEKLDEIELNVTNAQTETKQAVVEIEEAKTY